MTAYDTAIDAIAGGPTWHAKVGESSGTVMAARVGPAGTYIATGVTYSVTGLVANNGADTAVTFARSGSGAASVNSPATFDGTGSHTYSLRIKPNGTAPVGSNQNVFGRTSYGLYLDTNNKPSIFAGAASSIYAAAAALTTGATVTLTYTFDGTVHKVYVDKVEVISATDTRVTGGALGIGTYPGNSGDLEATIDEPKFWPVALTPTQVGTLVDADTGGGGGGGASAQTNRLLMGVG
jgi:hypothetical protein